MVDPVTSRSLWRLDSGPQDSPTARENSAREAPNITRSEFRRHSVLRRDLGQRGLSQWSHNQFTLTMRFAETQPENEYQKKSFAEHCDTMRVYPEENMEDFRRRANKRLQAAEKESISCRQRLEKIVKLKTIPQFA